MVRTGRYRRDLLRSGTVLLAIGTAGCLGGSGADPSPTPTQGCREPGSSASVDVPRVADRSTAGDLGLTIAEARLSEAVIKVAQDGPYRVIKDGTYEPGEQFLEMSLALEDGDVTGEALALASNLVVDGADRDARFISTREHEDGTIAVPVPAEASEASIRFERDGTEATWEVPGELVSQFGIVPDFAVRDARLQLGPGCNPQRLVLAVENAGDRDGTFRGLVKQANLSDGGRGVTVDVPEGATVEGAVRLNLTYPHSRRAELTSVSEGTRRFEYAVEGNDAG